MNKFSLSKSPIDLACNSSMNLAITVLILLVSFNLGWLLMFIRLYNRSNIVILNTTTVVNFESLLLLGNLSIPILFIACAWRIKNLRESLAKKNKN